MKPLLQIFCFVGVLLCGLAHVAHAGIPLLPAELIINSPTNHQQFSSGATIPIQVTAVDPDGAILRVEFFAGTQRIGVSQIATLVEVPPGTPVQHEFDWKDASTGPHILTVLAKDAAGSDVISAPVVIRVGGDTDAASIHIIAPKDLAEFTGGDDVPIVAEARDPAGLIDMVEFFANDEKIGESNYNFCPPCDKPPCPLGPCILPPVGTVLTHAFTWTNPPVGKYVLEARGTTAAGVSIISSAVRIAVTGPPTKSSLTFNAPKEGQTIKTPGLVSMEVTAVDPQSEIRRVEFFADDQQLGVSEILTKDAIIPGRPRVHHFIWTNPPAGPHALLAKAADAEGNAVVSDPRHILVEGDNTALPTVTIATGNQLSEHGDLKSRFGSFQVTRQGGDLTQPLTVFYVLGGTATPGADYQLLDPALPVPDPTGSDLRTLVIPMGLTSMVIAFEALPDNLVEGMETVVATLVEPPFANPLPSDYLLGDPHEAQVEILDADATVPSVVLNAPADQAAFTAPATIHVEATAVDPDLGIVSIQFYANGMEIGEASYCCHLCPCAVPVAGKPFTGAIDWTNVMPGDYTVVAQATAFGDVIFKSSPITIHVLGTSPRLTITQPTNGAAVRADQKTKVVAVGIGRVGGITDVDLLLDGTKVSESHVRFIRAPGADEPVQHVFEVLIPEGTHELVARDEADATVVSPAVTVTSVQPTPPATLTWVSPAADAKFSQGTPIDFEVKAVDPLGLITHADFFADGKKLGGGDFICPECRLSPGATIALGFQWTNAPKGRHILLASATDSAGHEVVSKRRGIEVTALPAPHIVATRQLPPVFLQGTKFTVSIEVKADEGVQNYVVEEHPPFVRVGGPVPPPDVPLWSVTAISDEGVFDPATSTVKFGPFLDHQTRTLTYEITPNAAAVDTATFDGVAVADGYSVKIGGDQILASSVRHPADDDPADDSISATELTAYGAAWKAGHAWSIGPNPIPMDYVTRAGALWRGGERYRFDPTAGPAPLWWVSAPLLIPLGAGSSEGKLVERAEFSGLALRSVSGGGGKPWEVALRVLLAPGTNVYALEEQVDGTPAEVSDDGEFDGATQTIRWGPFLDQQPRTLKYQLAETNSPHLERGTISFNGRSFVVHSAPRWAAIDGPHLVSLETTEDGARQIVLEDDSLLTGAGYDLEVSTDLGHWARAGSFVSEHSAGFARDEAPLTDGPRFYRAVRVK